MTRKVTIDRSQSYRIVEAIGRSDLVGCRCRIMLSTQTKKIDTDSRGFLHGQRGYMLTGKHKESTVDLPPVRLQAVNAFNCRCDAYKFPHAPGLGKCKSEGEQTAPKGLTLEELFND